MIEKNNIKVYPVDNFMVGLKICPNVFIINSDISAGNGIHYFVCYIYQPFHIFVIDSLGNKNIGQRPYDKIFLNILNDNNFNIQFYNYKFQQNNSVHCGWFAIYICKLIQKLNYPSIDILKNKIIDIFGKTADDDDELVILKSFGYKL